MISYELFEKYMMDYVEQQQVNESWADSINAALGVGACEEIYEHNYSNLFLNFLTDVMEDNDEWIYYFVYEKYCNWFEIYFKDNEGTTEEVDKLVKIDSFRKLYDLIKNGTI